jgi:hypothetical protein
MTGPAEPALVDGVDVDAVAAAVRGCPAVDDLDGGPLGGVATYLPGRRVPGIRISESRVEVHVRGVWNVPVATVASQIRGALATLIGGRSIDIVLTDVADPGQVGTSSAQVPAGGILTTGDKVESWTTPSASAEPSGGSSSVPTIPTAAEIRPNS